MRFDDYIYAKNNVKGLAFLLIKLLKTPLHFGAGGSFLLTRLTMYGKMLMVTRKTSAASATTVKPTTSSRTCRGT